MSGVTAIRFEPVALRPERITGDITIGKDVLELLAGSMYADPLTVYREYVQNAADALDEATLGQSHFDEPPGVRIFIDHAERTIRIRDNGISVPADEFVSRITAIGASGKRGRALRGFRGVGRLSGLGYCQELIFRGRADGEQRVTEVLWDAKSLREKLRDASYTGGLADVVKEIATVSYRSGVDFPKRFFEVELRKVVRLRNDLLLNEDMVRNYLSQVAPVPFDPRFPHGEKVQKYLDKWGIKSAICLELMDGRGAVFHRLADGIQASAFQFEPFRDVEFVEFKGPEGEVDAIGWIVDHAYVGALPRRFGLGGLRARVGNIQVGDEQLLSSLFVEPRFSSWVVGDIHVISPKLVPNGRRDDFEANSRYAHLQAELGLLSRELVHRIRKKSEVRNRTKTVNVHFAQIANWLEVLRSRSVPPLLHSCVHDVTEKRLGVASRDIAKLDENSAERQAAERRHQELTKGVRKIKPRSAKEGIYTPRMSKATDRAIRAAISVILQNAATPLKGLATARQVVDAVTQSK